ncbi:major facilitator superfamily-like protein [Aureococcus anophagefferens]|nr:major facilitator superfamily-like protein [Aureococcus anophagefferens]
MPSRSVPTTPSSGGRGSPQSARHSAGEAFEEDQQLPARNRLRVLIRKHLDKLSKGRAARRKLNDLRKKIESRKDRALARRRERRRARSGAASPTREDLGYASDGGSPRKEPLGAVPARALPWEGAASTGALLTPTKAEAPVLSRDRLPSGDMTPLDVSEEELEAELSESDDDSLDEDEGPTPDARAVQAAILAALGDVDRSVRALACGVAVAALLCVDAYVSSPAAGVAGMVAALGPLAPRRSPSASGRPASGSRARDWVDKSEDDPYFSSRLKGIFMCHPLKGEKLPSLLDKWNGKPVLMAASGGLGRRPGISTFHRARDAVEVGLNIGESFSYMGRGAVYMMIGKLATLDCDVCFTVEGRADDELPEVVLGASTFSALKLSEKFANLMPPTS